MNFELGHDPEKNVIINFVNFKFSDFINSHPQKSPKGPEWSKWVFLHTIPPQLVNIGHLRLYLYTCPTLRISESSIQKLKIWDSVTFKNCSKFWMESFETSTHHCEKTVGRSWILIFASERGPLDLGWSVLCCIIYFMKVY